MANASPGAVVVRQRREHQRTVRAPRRACSARAGDGGRRGAPPRDWPSVGGSEGAGSGRLLENNAQTEWVPAFVKERRFHNWLAGARDWAVLMLLYGAGLRIGEATGLTGAALPLGPTLSVTGKRAKNGEMHFLSISKQIDLFNLNLTN